MRHLSTSVSIVLLVAIGLAVLPLPSLTRLAPQGHLARATEFISPSFKILDPVLDTGGTASSSATNFFQLGAQGQLSIGRSDSGNFILKSGFLYFPAPAAVSPTPTPTPTPGGGGVVLPFPFNPYPPYEIFRRLFIQEEPEPFCADLNGDGIVGLVDASIMFFGWFDADALAAGFLLKSPRPDCNDDGLVDIIDLSILLFWWDEI